MGIIITFFYMATCTTILDFNSQAIEVELVQGGKGAEGKTNFETGAKVKTDVTAKTGVTAH